ncbi:MAG: alpha/beta hydrolase [Myxococcota bacterium]
MKPWACGDVLAGEERPFFLSRGQHALAVMHHATSAPRGVVVLAGPMTLERSHGYLTWVRWARTLAHNGYEVFRFDASGVGESTGDFHTRTFDAWRDDLDAVVSHARHRGPVTVIGLRLGALLGAKLFEAGRCDAFVAWEPPAGGRQMLMEMLRRKLAADLMELSGERRSREEYVKRLEGGELVEVEGYEWSRGLWQSAAAFEFVAPKSERSLVLHLDGRDGVRIPKPVFWGQSNVLVPELGELFERTCAFLDGLSLGPVTAAPPEADLTSRTPGAVAQTTRELELLEGCVGTAHRPAERTSRLGLLWVNFGYVPRDGHGGLATQVCDVMAAHGVPGFRFDLPGLGDTPGPLLPDTQQFYPFVTSGGFAPIVARLVERLCEREQLDGLIFAGLCGGAINAIYAGDAEPARVKGLVLLEPELYTTEPNKSGPEAPRQRLRDRLRERLPPQLPLVDALLAKHLPFEDQLRAKLFSYWGWMRLLTHENRYARYLPLPRKAILDFVLHRSELPAVTNLPLAHAWQRWVMAQRPVLTITAKGKLREVFFDRINEKVLSGVTRRNYEHARLENTNHIFTSGGAIATVTAHIERAWPMLTATAPV